VNNIAKDVKGITRYVKTAVLTGCAVLLLGTTDVLADGYDEYPEEQVTTVEYPRDTTGETPTIVESPTEYTNFRITGGLLQTQTIELYDIFNPNAQNEYLSQMQSWLALLSGANGFNDINVGLTDFLVSVLTGIESDVTFDTERVITGTARSHSRVLVHVFSIADGEVIFINTNQTYVGASGVFSLEAPLYVSDNVVVVVSVIVDEVLEKARISIIATSINSMDPEIRNALENRSSTLPGRTIWSVLPTLPGFFHEFE
jgi:hypothetical protein